MNRKTLLPFSFFLLSFLAASAATTVPASAYVQDGLIAQWDGIDNVGTGTHSGETLTWKDLKGSCDLTRTSNGYWADDDAFHVANGCAAAGATAAPDYDTIEVVYRSSSVDGEVLFSSGLSGGRRYVAFSNDEDAIAVYADGSGADGYYARTPQETGVLRSFTARYAADSVISVATNGLKIVNPSRLTQELGTGAGVLRLGAMNASDDKAWSGEIFAIRLYSRALADRELALNANLDAMRFAAADAAALTWPDGYRYTSENRILECRLTATATTGGEVRFATGTADEAVEGWATLGSASVTVVAVPASGYRFDCWLGDTAGLDHTAAQVTFSTDRPRTLTARFTAESATSPRYYPLEYIEGRGSQWLDTEEKLCGGQTFRLLWSQNPEITYSGAGDSPAWGAGTAKDGWQGGGGKQASYYDFSVYHNGYNTFSPSIGSAAFVLGDVYEDVCRVEDDYFGYTMCHLADKSLSSLASITNSAGAAYETSTSIYLLRRSYANNYAYRRVHGATLFDTRTGEAVFNLVPVVREVDLDGDAVQETVMLYDTVTGREVTNKVPSKALIAGARSTDNGARWSASGRMELETAVTVSGDGSVTVDGSAACSATNFWKTAFASVTLRAVPRTGAAFVGWGGEIGLDHRFDAELTLTVDRARKVVARFVPAEEGDDYWLFSSIGRLTHSVNGIILTARVGSGKLSLNGVNTLAGNTTVDLNHPLFTDDLKYAPPLTAIGGSAFKNNTALAHFSMPDTVTSIGSQSFYGCTALRYTRLSRNVQTIGGGAFQAINNQRLYLYPEPIFPPTLTSIGSPAFKFSWSTNDTVYLSNPAFTTWSSEMFGRTYFRVVDCRGSGITTISTGALYSNSYFEDFFFPKGFKSITPSSNFLGNCSRAKHLYFSGDPITFSAYNSASACTSTSLCWCIPKWNKNWEVYLADSEQCVMTSMTSAACEYFASGHPGEAMPVKSMKACTPASGTYWTTSKPMGVSYWYPDAPPTYETVSYFDILAWEGSENGGVPTKRIAASVTPAAATNLFDGTLYSASTKLTQYLWTGDGTAVVYELPEAATNTRALKFTGYRVHQASLGDYRNARAPTKWKLEGMLLKGEDWITLDEVTLTAESTKKWAYMDDPTTYTTAKAGVAPDCDHASLEFEIALDKQDAYKAFRFTPLASYQTENSVTDATPYSLMEIEFLGLVTTADPVIGDFAVATPRWTSIDFTGSVAGYGDDAAKDLHATGAYAWTEVATNELFTGEIFRSDKVAAPLNTVCAFGVSGLTGNTNYYARLVVSNDLGLVSMKTLEGGCATLAAPFTAEQPVASTNAAGRLTVAFTLEELYTAQADIALYYRATPTGEWTKLVNKSITATGTVDFGELTTVPGESSSVRITVTADGVTDEFEASTFECWIVDAAKLTVSNSKDFSSFTVTIANGDKVSLKAISDLNDVTDFDFTRPFIGTDGADYTLQSVGTAFKSNTEVKKVLLPDSVTSVAANAFQECAALQEVRLSSVLTSVGAYAFYNCKSLSKVEPMLPDTCTSIGDHSFYSTAIREVSLSDGITSLASAIFEYCGSLGKVKLPANLETFSTWVFAYCYALTNVAPRFLPDTVRTLPEHIFNSCPVQTERLYLENPLITSIGGGAFNNTRCKYIDLSKTHIANLVGGFGSMHSLKELIFPTTLTNFAAVAFHSFNGSNQGVEVIFNGDVPTITSTDNIFYNCNANTLFYFRAHRGNASWRKYLEDNSGGESPLVRPLTAAERTAFKARFPKQAVASCMLSLSPASRARYVYFRYLPPGLMVILR